MGHGYVVIYDITGEIISYDRAARIFIWELRPSIKDWRYDGPHLKPFDQPPLYEVARWFEEFWTSGEPMPVHNGLYAGPGQRIEVLRVDLEPGVRLRVTLRSLGSSHNSLWQPRTKTATPLSACGCRGARHRSV